MVRIVQCAFWLSIVYVAILTHGTFRLGELKWDGSGAMASSPVGTSDLVGTLAAGTTFCARHADECLADAKQLTALFAAAEPQSADDDPAPVHDMRHNRRDAKRAPTP